MLSLAAFFFPGGPSPVRVLLARAQELFQHVGDRPVVRAALDAVPYGFHLFWPGGQRGQPAALCRKRRRIPSSMKPVWRNMGKRK